MFFISLSSLIGAFALTAGWIPVDTHLPLVPVQAEGDSDNALAGTQWLLRSINGKDADANIGSTLNFDDNGSAYGNGGCNRFIGAVTIEGNKLEFGDLASTMMACEEEKSRQDGAFHVAMGEARSFRIEDGDLLLLNELEEVVARLTAAP